MTPDMIKAVDKIHGSQYSGITRLMFLKSQIGELIAHFFALLETDKKEQLWQYDKEKLFQAIH